MTHSGAMVVTIHHTTPHLTMVVTLLMAGTDGTDSHLITTLTGITPVIITITMMEI